VKLWQTGTTGGGVPSEITAFDWYDLPKISPCSLRNSDRGSLTPSCRAVLARLIKQVFEFAKSLDGKRAGRLQEHLEDARPVAPDKRISAPCLHAIFPLPGSVRGKSPKRSNASGS